MAITKTSVTVAGLIAALSTMDKDAVVLMSSDPEGNAIRKMQLISPEAGGRVVLWPGLEV